MNKKIAFDNRLCYERDVVRTRAIHQHKLQTILPTCHSPSKVYLDSNEPTRQPHLLTNRKRMQMERERQLDIYTQNQRLASKMEHILNRQENVVLAAGTPSSPLSPRARESPKKALVKPVHSPAHVHMPGIRLNATQTPMVDCYLSPEFASGRGNACKKDTLVNRGVQKQKQQRIEEENRRMKERLKAQKPFYNAKKWDSDWQLAAQRFQHLHQNGTVGYLVSKTAPTPGTATARRSPQVNHRRVKPRSELPSLSPPSSTPEHSSLEHGRGGRLRRQLQAKQSQSVSVAQEQTSVNVDDADDEEEPEVIECEPFVLLEATTRKGVELYVDELQIEMRDLSSGIVQPGDRGLLVRGRWKEHVTAECMIGKDTLERVAQEIDDLEMMIKLETVSTLSGLGNFPRLSTLLTENELERLLLKLVQVLNVQVVEDTPELIITSRLIRSPSPTSKERHDDRARPCNRPRTCPSTLPSDTPLISSSDFTYDDGDSSTLLSPTDVDSFGEDAQQFSRVLCRQFAALVNGDGAGSFSRRGIRLVDGHFYLARYTFSAEVSSFMVKLLLCAQSYSTECSYNIVVEEPQVSSLLDQIRNAEVEENMPPAQVAWTFIGAELERKMLSEPTHP